MYKVQKEAKAVKKELSNIHVESEIDGVVATVSADQELLSLDIPDELVNIENKAKLQKAIITSVKKATKKAQEIAAEKMKGIMGQMGFGA